MNLEKITQEVKAVAISAGTFIYEERKKFRKRNVEFKGGGEMVSYVDRKAEEMLVESLGGLVPGAGFITEEETTPRETNTYTWIIDPLDGTTNFIYDIPNYCVSIGLLHENEIVIGVVYNIANDECFTAWKGGGAYLDHKQIHVGKEAGIPGCLIATGFPGHDLKKMQEHLAILNELTGSGYGLRCMGSAASDLAYVACGRYCGYFEYNLNIWDVAAGIILIKEAGGIVTDLRGGDGFLSRGGIVSGGTLHPELLRIIERRW